LLVVAFLGKTVDEGKGKSTVLALGGENFSSEADSDENSSDLKDRVDFGHQVLLSTVVLTVSQLGLSEEILPMPPVFSVVCFFGKLSDDVENSSDLNERVDFGHEVLLFAVVLTVSQLGLSEEILPMAPVFSVVCFFRKLLDDVENSSSISGSKVVDVLWPPIDTIRFALPAGVIGMAVVEVVVETVVVEVVLVNVVVGVVGLLGVDG
jgi:hypothetical protein